MKDAINRTQSVAQVLSKLKQSGIYQFSAGAPGADILPLSYLQQILKDTEFTPLDYTYGSLNGYEELREMIADVWRLDFAVDDIFLTSGSQSAIGLIFRIFEHSNIVLEEPTFMVQIINGLLSKDSIYSIPINLKPPYWDLTKLEELVKQTSIRLMYVIPNFHNPTGLTMPIAVREKLAWLAKKYDFWILEDDPYGMLTFDNHTKKMPALYSLAPNHVIYTSSFSKILAPGLRLGFMVITNKDLKTKLLTYKLVSDMHPTTIVQRIATIFLQKYFTKHIQEVNTQLYKRATTMYSLLSKRSDLFELGPAPSGGMFIWLQLKGQFDYKSDVELANSLLEHKIAVMPGSIFFKKQPTDLYIRLSFATETPKRIKEGIAQLIKVM